MRDTLKIRMRRIFSAGKTICGVFVLGIFLFSTQAYAAEGASLSSDGFRILDPQHSGFGGIASSSSTSFKLLGTVGDIAIGSASATSFGLRSGFLYFPQVVNATLTAATPGDAEVALTWLAAEVFQGFTLTGYNVCTKPSSGTYTCENVGSVLLYTKTGLTNGTTYTFKVQARDAFGNAIGNSNELSTAPNGATPTPTPTATPPPGGGGGGPSTASIKITGYAYPNAEVWVLRNAQLIGTVSANAAGTFSFIESGLGGGSYKYTLYGIDVEGVRSAAISLVANLTSGYQADVGGIILPPTIALEDDQLTNADTLVVHGRSFPGANVVVEITNANVYLNVTVGTDGFYEVRHGLSGLRKGIYWVRSKTILAGGNQSPYSTLVGFGLDVPFKQRVFNIPKCGALTKPDLNCDGRVNIVDVSILMYYYKQPVRQGKEFVDFNNDGKVDIIEFSILVYFWTG